MAYWFLVILILATAGGARKDILPEDAQQQLQRIETRLNQIYDMLETDRMNRNHPWN